MTVINPITNDDMYQAAKLVLLPHLGYYATDNNVRLPAIYFDSAPEVSNVFGLECIIPPRISNNRHHGCVTTSYYVWYISLVNHPGRQTIYDAAEELAKIGQESRVIWSSPDKMQSGKPSATIRIGSVNNSCEY